MCVCLCLCVCVCATVRVRVHACVRVLVHAQAQCGVCWSTRMRSACEGIGGTCAPVVTATTGPPFRPHDSASVLDASGTPVRLYEGLQAVLHELHSAPQWESTAIGYASRVGVLASVVSFGLCARVSSVWGWSGGALESCRLNRRLSYAPMGRCGGVARWVTVMLGDCGVG